MQERCVGCLDNHCRRCLWQPPGAAPDHPGVCAHCVFQLMDLGMGGRIDAEREEDEHVFAAAQEDEVFMLFATRLGDVWDEAEKLLQRFVMSEVGQIRTPRV